MLTKTYIGSWGSTPLVSSLGCGLGGTLLLSATVSPLGTLGWSAGPAASLSTFYL